MEKFNKIKEVIAGLEDDAVKFYEKGNSAAGTRLRSGLQLIKTLAQEGRVEVTDIKTNRKGDSE